MPYAAAGAHVLGVARSFAETHPADRSFARDGGIRRPGRCFGVQGDAADPELAQRLLARDQPRHRRPQRRRAAAHRRAFGAELGVVQHQLELRHPTGVRVDRRGAAAAASTRFHRDRNIERGSDGRLPAQRRIRPGECGHPIRAQLRQTPKPPGRLTRYSIRHAAPTVDAAHRTRASRPPESYAEYNGLSIDEYLGKLGALLTPSQVGRAVIDIAENTEPAAEYLLSGQGLRPLPIAE